VFFVRQDYYYVSFGMS